MSLRRPALMLSLLLALTPAAAQTPASAAAPASAPAGPDLTVTRYTVQPSDTLIQLGRTLLVNPAAWPEIAKLNKLRNPDIILPGQVLLIPSRLLRAGDEPAKVLSVEGDVRVENVPIKAGDVLRLGQRLSTATNGAATVELIDGSRVIVAASTDTQLTDHRRFPVKAGTEIPAGSDGNMFITALRLLRGSVETLATKVLRAKPLEVSTPTAVIGVRGTRFRVQTDGSPNSPTRTEVFEGKVRAELNSGEGVDVSAGQGVALEVGKAPVVVELPAAPSLEGIPARFENSRVEFALPSTENLPVRVRIAADSGMGEVVFEQKIEPGGKVRIDKLPPGTWHVRARRIDTALGLEGNESDFSFTVAEPPPPPPPPPPVLPPPDAPALQGPTSGDKLAAGEVTLSWSAPSDAATVVVQVARDANFTQLVQDVAAPVAAGVAADPAARPPSTSGQTTLALNEPGTYHWRLASRRTPDATGPWSAARSFELRPLPAAPSAKLSTDGKLLQLSWALRPNASRYEAQLARDPEFRELVAEQGTSAGSWSLPTPEPPDYYHLRYRVIEADGYVTPWSAALRVNVPHDMRFLMIILPMFLGL